MKEVKTLLLVTMATPYSYDLRQKVIEALDKGMRKSEAARVFGLSRNTIDNWLKRRQTSGEFQAKSGYQKGSRHQITDWDSFGSFVKENSSLTQEEMAHIWEGEISRHPIGRGLKKIKFTRKKRHMVIKKELNSCVNNSKLKSNNSTQKH